MGTLTLVLWLAIAVLVSAVIDQIVPRVSLPLIQIGMGVVIAVFARSVIEVNLEPDLFLVLFIAPLLYIEAKHADRMQLWQNRGPILSLAIGLVVVTAVAIGFVVHTAIPAISLAAAFALGAALGPTDAVAVTSLSKQIDIPHRQWSVLKGELLLNDASGIVMFQFALTAALSGSFDVAHIGIDFLIEFVGGLACGAVLGYGANFVLRKIRDIGVEGTTFHVLYELCVPFIVYLAAQAVHVSGIIAVVVAGLLNVISPRRINPNVSRMNIVSSNVWDVLSFALNGIVFVLLGTQLPASMMYTWEDETINNLALIGYILLITLILMGVRFIWCTVMEWRTHRKADDGTPFGKQDLRHALLLTLCGAKGTITLSILFTIPVFISPNVRFPGRNLIIFLGCGVILITLLLATFVVPLVAPKRERKQSEIEARRNYYEVLADIQRNVIEELTAQMTKRNRRATRAVIQAYQDRLAKTKNTGDIPDELNVELRVQVLKWEQERTLALIEQGVASRDVGYEFLGRLERMERLTRHRADKITAKRIGARARILLTKAKLAVIRRIPGKMRTDTADQMRQLQLETARYVVDVLRKEMAEGSVPIEDASNVLLEYERMIVTLSASAAPSVTNAIKANDDIDEIRRHAYHLEFEQIQKMYEADRITRQEAREMRDNVNLMMMDLDDKL